MCGIAFFKFNRKITSDDVVKSTVAFTKISHRGPDSMTVIVLDKINSIFCFLRLSINDLTLRGDQPFKKIFKGVEYYLMCNGEIYNSKEIEEQNKKLSNRIKNANELLNKSNSDCECILNDLIINNMEIDHNKYISEHAMIGVKISQDNSTHVVVSSDRFGKRPLFMGECKDGIFFASELQGIPLYDNIIVTRFEPRTNLDLIYKNGKIIKNFIVHYNIRSIKINTARQRDSILEGIRYYLGKAVKRMVTTDPNIELGTFLSGGLDSSVVTYEANESIKSIKKYSETDRLLETISVGLPQSDDGIWAKRVSKQIGTYHHHFTFEEEEYIKNSSKVVKCTGSFCRTTNRASGGQLIAAERAKNNTNLTVLLSGDGSDELFFSYDDCKDCHSEDDFERKTFELLENIHTSDGLRADRCNSFYGLEVRFPFLDNDFVNFILSIPIHFRMPVNGITKPLLREAYEKQLSYAVAYRDKVTFSDGIGNKEKQSRDILTTHFESFYTDEEYEIKRLKYIEHCIPECKEALFYREVFTEEFSSNLSIAKTIPYEWKPEFKQSSDPSAWFTAAI